MSSAEFEARLARIVDRTIEGFTDPEGPDPVIRDADDNVATFETTFPKLSNFFRRFRK